VPLFVPHPAFDLPDAEALLWRSAPELPPPPDVYLDRAAEVRPPARTAVLLTRQEELVLFVRLNFARRRAAETADPGWAARARDLEDAVVRYNVGLVVSVAGHDEEAAAAGLATLLKAARHFDAARGWKFSTYAMRAVCRSISRLRARQARRIASSRAVICAGEKVLSLGDGSRSIVAHRAAREAERDAQREEERAERLRDAVSRAGLTPDERHVLSRRVGAEAKPPSFEAIGRELGFTKERARQLHAGALAKVRAAYEGQPPRSAPPEPSPRGA
jgi:RNA polymerase primary sigma factor